MSSKNAIKIQKQHKSDAGNEALRWKVSGTTLMGWRKKATSCRTPRRADGTCWAESTAVHLRTPSIKSPINQTYMRCSTARPPQRRHAAASWRRARFVCGAFAPFAPGLYSCGQRKTGPRKPPMADVSSSSAGGSSAVVVSESESSSHGNLLLEGDAVAPEAGIPRHGGAV
jgi:hypothetical protein